MPKLITNPRSIQQSPKAIPRKYKINKNFKSEGDENFFIEHIGSKNYNNLKKIATYTFPNNIKIELLIEGKITIKSSKTNKTLFSNKKQNFSDCLLSAKFAKSRLDSGKFFIKSSPKILIKINEELMSDFTFDFRAYLLKKCNTDAISTIACSIYNSYIVQQSKTYRLLDALK